MRSIKIARLGCEIEIGPVEFKVEFVISILRAWAVAARCSVSGAWIHSRAAAVAVVEGAFSASQCLCCS